MSLARRLDDARRKLPPRGAAPAEHHQRRSSLKASLNDQTYDHTTATAKPKRRKGNDRA